ncbi:MAG TPA: HupE/UreJ family protein, partial [Kofleriaceae bacterium]|nr:HupE/UreJ family protein [Kofleriaceae bacterium]
AVAVAVAVAVAAILVALSGPAMAHDVRGEVLFLDIGERAIDIEIQIPILQLELARGIRFGTNPKSAVAADQIALVSYAENFVGAKARDGRAFAMRATRVAVENVAGHDVVVVRARLDAPEGTNARWFEIHDDMVLHQVVTDTVYVFLRTDLQTGVIGESPTLVDYLRYQQRSLVVDRSSGSRWQSFTTVFDLGIEHIADGTDHLLFLLVLLIPAPLAASAGRWRERRGGRASLIATAKIVTAFTIGHSITLVIGAVFGAVLPSAVVETLIGVSILVTAIHALRPVFPGREALVAAAFGLIHGLAFATTLASFGVDGTSIAIGVLGFNLGVEAMQICVLVLTVPWLLVLARRDRYTYLRVAAATFAILAALAWIAERTSILHTPIPAFVENVASRAPYILAGLATLAIGSELAARLRRKRRG